MRGIAIIGLGYWGQNLLRNIHNSNLWDSIFIFDLDKKKNASSKKLYSSVNIANSVAELIENKNIESIIICTPPETHFKIAKTCLLNGKHILVEKPFTNSLNNALELQQIADEKDLKIMVDYTFLYTGAVQKIKELYDSNSLGKLLYIDSTRINLGIFQSKVNVVWDLACHDLSIINYITDLKPKNVQANGISHSSSGLENIAYITIDYGNNIIVHLNCSWTSPVKIRQMLIAGDKKMIVYNDIEPTDKIKVYDTGFSETVSEEIKNKTLIDYRMGDVYSPKVDTTEALSGLIKEFYNFTVNNALPKSNLELSLNVLKVLEGIEYSIKNDNCKVIL